jgi:LysR family nitrogen assimilation transcriptional regulator
LDIRHLRYFACIVELKSFARAAEELHVAQSALGLHIRNLESELKVKLLTRHSRGVEPTDAGMVLHGHAIKIIQELVATRQAMASLAARDKVRLTIGMTPPIQRLFATVLGKQARLELPGVALTIVDASSAALLERVRNGEIDLCCVYGDELSDRGDRCALFLDETMFVRRRPARTRLGPTITLAEAARHPLALPALPHRFRRLIEEGARQHGVTLDVAFESQALPVVSELIDQGRAAGLLPFGAVACDIDNDRLAIQRLVEPAINQQLLLVRTERRTIAEPEPGIESLLRQTLGVEIAEAKRRWLASFPAAAAARTRLVKP